MVADPGRHWCCSSHGCPRNGTAATAGVLLHNAVAHHPATPTFQSFAAPEGGCSGTSSSCCTPAPTVCDVQLMSDGQRTPAPVSELLGPPPGAAAATPRPRGPLPKRLWPPGSTLRVACHWGRARGAQLPVLPDTAPAMGAAVGEVSMAGGMDGAADALLAVQEERAGGRARGGRWWRR
jgi:hypothetical protein